MTKITQGVTVQPSPRDGKFVNWKPFIGQPSGNGPSGQDHTGSKYTIVDGVFYGFVYVTVPSTSDLGSDDSHWHMQLPYRPAKETIEHITLLGWGNVTRNSARPGRYHECKLEIGTFYDYEDMGIIWPIFTFYNTGTMDNPPDTALLYEWWNNGEGAKVEGTKTAWTAIATDFGRESQKALSIRALMRYPIK